MTLDYSIQSSKERNNLVKKIIQKTPPQQLTNQYLQILADYIIFAMTKEEKKSYKINTQNRLVTIKKRQMSFQGLVTKFQSGEDAIYNLITNDKNMILTPKISITPQDIETIPPLQQLREAIEKTELAIKKSSGRRRYLLKKQLIEMRKDQYVIKMAYKKPSYCLNAVTSFNSISFNDNIEVNDGIITDNSTISFMNPAHISALLCNYVKLKEDSYANFLSDGYYLIQDLQNLIDRTLKERYPLYFDLLTYKIDGKQNTEIQSLLQTQYNITYSIQYLSSLWRKKIPKLIAEQAQRDYLTWYYTYKERGHWKKCSRCGQIKLIHNKFFSKNSSSKDGFYSICKECRNAAAGQRIIRRVSAPQEVRIIRETRRRKER